MHRSRFVTGIAVVAVLLAGGCSGPDDDVESASTPTATASPSPSPSPTPSPTSTREPEPEPGPDFERDDEIGAQAAAVYFLDLYGYMIRTGDADRFTAISWMQTCAFCARALESTREIHAEATVVEGTEESVEILKVYEFDEFGGGYPLDIRITETDGLSFNADGVLIHTEEGGSVDSRIELIHDGTTWRLVNLVRLEEIQ